MDWPRAEDLRRADGSTAKSGASGPVAWDFAAKRAKFMVHAGFWRRSMIRDMP